MDDRDVPVWPLIRGLTEHDRNELLGMGRRRRYRRDEVIFHEADRADSVHLIERGHVASCAFIETGETVTYRVFGPGDTFGLLALQSGVARRYGTTIALDEVVTLVIDAEHLRSRCLGNAAMGQVLIDLLATEVRAFAAALVEALFVPVEVRVLRRLTALAHLYGHGEAGTVIPLTQEGLAGLAGTSRASVSKVLKGLEEANIVERRRSAVFVADPEALAWAATHAPRGSLSPP
ncbi:Crp/Fnr family transcriptional regulator [Pseudonocardia sp. GCM10023141]|uniref:Crp/Fnr family transcriptional regulator n=1 Tax=Pseudonocardia sp. GCM10023141 TaxID=3252653 RepID=UPI0036172AD9